MPIFVVGSKKSYFVFWCRSRASHHSEDGDPRLHASSHPGDAGELRRSGEWSLRQPAQWCTARQLQPQSVPELCPKQSTHTVTVVTVHPFEFSWCSAYLPSDEEEQRRRGSSPNVGDQADLPLCYHKKPHLLICFLSGAHSSRVGRQGQGRPGRL